MFLLKSPFAIRPEHIHLIGVVSLLIASKSEEVALITLNTMLNDIIYHKYS